MILLVPLAFAMNCTYDSTPTIRPFINWACENITSRSCLSFVEFNNELIQVNPIGELVEGMGRYDQFIVGHGHVHPYFRQDLLRHDKQVVFGVKCGNETFRANITPQYTDFVKVIDRGTWLRDNVGYLVGGICFILIILILIRWLWEQRK